MDLPLGFSLLSFFSMETLGSFSEYSKQRPHSLPRVDRVLCELQELRGGGRDVALGRAVVQAPPVLLEGREPPDVVVAPAPVTPQGQTPSVVCPGGRTSSSGHLSVSTCPKNMTRGT